MFRHVREKIKERIMRLGSLRGFMSARTCKFVGAETRQGDERGEPFFVFVRVYACKYCGNRKVEFSNNPRLSGVHA